MVGQRVDKVIAELCGDFSRSTIQTWIKRGLVVVDDEQPRQKDKVLGGEMVDLAVPQQEKG